MLDYIQSFLGIKTSLKLTDDQINAIVEIDEFINSKVEQTMTLAGYAGTGKTTLMQIIADKYRDNRKMPIHFCATTHKAATVLASKTHEIVSTVHSLFGIKVEEDLDTLLFDTRKKKNVKTTEHIKKNSLVIIDEASMLSKQNYLDIKQSIEDYNAKCIFIGDPAQLAPVNEEDISLVFRDNNERVVNLTQIVRTKEHSILDESLYIRNSGNFSYKTNDKIKYISNKDEIVNALKAFTEELKQDPNSVKILAYTNKSVKGFNSTIRKKFLGYDSSIPQKGEPLMAYSNWKYLYGDYEITNSESYTCKGIKEIKEIDLSDKCKGIPIKIKVHYLYVTDSLEFTKIIPFVDVIDNLNNRSAVEYLVNLKIQLWKEYRAADSKVKYKYLQYIHDIEEYLLINDSIKTIDGRVLQEKVIDFGYAHTIHKSQGSTYKKVLINDVDIQKCSEDAVQKQLRYVALTRAQDFIIIVTNKKYE